MTKNLHGEFGTKRDSIFHLKVMVKQVDFHDEASVG